MKTICTIGLVEKVGLLEKIGSVEKLGLACKKLGLACKVESMAAVRSLTVGSLVITAIAQVPVASAEVNLRGFGSIVAGKALSTSDDQAILGYTDTLDFKRESLFALQADADLDENLTATMQFMSRGKADFDVNVEWAYLTYEINDGLKLSAGRIRAPYYRYSDFLDVHYALNWVTAPERVYAFEFPGYDGLSLMHNTSFGSIDSALQIIYGNTEGEIGSGRLITKGQTGVSWVGAWEWLSVRLSYLSTKEVELNLAQLDATAASVNALATGLGNVGAGFAQVALADPTFSPYATAYSDASVLMLNAANNITINGDKGIYEAFGFSIDRDKLVIDSEISYFEVENALLPSPTSYYMTVGWRFGPTLVYTTYSREQADAPYAITDKITDLTSVANSLTPYAGVPQLATLVDGATQLASGAKQLRNGLLGSEVDIVNWNIGMRWDFHPSAAFKVSYEKSNDRIKDTDGAAIRAAVDLVF